MNDIKFKLHKFVLSQGSNKIVLYLPLEVVENDNFLRPLIMSDVQLIVCGCFDFVPCGSDSLMENDALHC